MELGTLVDYCIEYNDASESEETNEANENRRKATQADWDWFWG